MSPSETGDYVLATKFHDGDPCDQFCVGYFVGMYRDGFLVANKKKGGTLYRSAGFRRCEKISDSVGLSILAGMRLIDNRPGKSIWYWRYHPAELDRLVEKIFHQAQELCCPEQGESV